MNKLLKNIFKLYKEAQVVKKAETIEQQINDNKYSIDTENSDNNKLLGTANDLVFAYDVISKAMDMAENQKEDEFAVYTLSPNKDKIVDMKYIKKDDVYDYKPNQNEYGLVRVRDTGFIDTDYQLQPMIMVIRSWNEGRDFYSSKKQNVSKKAREEWDWYTYQIELQSDDGPVTIYIAAPSADSAKRSVLKAENAPESAIKLVHRLTDEEERELYASKTKIMRKRAKNYKEYIWHFNDIMQDALFDNKGDFAKAVEYLLTFASSEYDKARFPREEVYKLVKEYIDDTVKFQEMINHPIKEEYITKAKELLNNYKVENKIATKTNKLQKKAGEWKLLKLIAEEMEENNKLYGSVPITDYAVYWNIEVYNDMKYLDISKLSKKAQDAILDEIETALKGGYSKGEIQVQEEFIDESDKKILNEDLLLEFFLNFEEKDLNLDDVEIDLGNEDLPDSFVKFRQLAKRNNKLQKKAAKTLEDVAILIDTVLDDFDHYDYADTLEVGENSAYESILADVQKDEKGTIESLFARIKEDDSDEPFTSKELDELKEYYNSKFGKTATKKQASLKYYAVSESGANFGSNDNKDDLKEEIREYVVAHKDNFEKKEKIYLKESDTNKTIEEIKVNEIVTPYGSKKWVIVATKKQADNGQKTLINAWYYHKIGDKYVREKIADRQKVYLKYPEKEEDRYALIDNVEDKLKSYAKLYFKPEKGSKLGDKIVITDYSTNENLGEIEYNENYISAKKHKILNKKATIKHENGVYNVYSESGKCLGKGYKTKEEAEKRLKQVEYFKNKKAEWKYRKPKQPKLYEEWCVTTIDDDMEDKWFKSEYAATQYFNKIKNKVKQFFHKVYDLSNGEPEEIQVDVLYDRDEDYSLEENASKHTNNNKKSLKQIVISKMAEKTRKIKFKGIDNWNRPIFVDIDSLKQQEGSLNATKGFYITDVNNLFRDGTTEQEIKEFYKDKELNKILVYKGNYPNSEPMGFSLEKDTLILV